MRRDMRDDRGRGPVGALADRLDDSFAKPQPAEPPFVVGADMSVGSDKPLVPTGNIVARGGLIAGAVSVFLLGFSAIVPLSEALILDGKVVAEGLVKTIQSAESGIVRSINVAENETVAPGAPLVVIENGETSARLERVATELGFVRTSRLRATSELDLVETGSIVGAVRGAIDGAPARVAQHAALQDRILDTRLDAHHRAMAARREALSAQRAAVDGIESQRLAAVTQAESLEAELDDLRKALRIGVASRREVSSVERGLVAQRGVVAALDAERARAQQGVIEAELALTRSEAEFHERALQELTELEQREGVLAGQSKLAIEASERLTLRAPLAGTVQNLAVRTVGAVVRAGDPILEIVPETGRSIVIARVAPGDIEGVPTGAAVEIQITSSARRDAAPLRGVVLSVSPETAPADRPGEEWFTARIGLVGDEARSGVRPGMRTQVFVQGNERTLLGYLAKPLHDALNATMRER